MSALGTAGCGFEQHLESALKAIWPAGDARLSFAAWFGAAASGGHSDNLNAGFVRTGTANAGSTLGIVIDADEDDCSAGEPAIFDNRTVDAGNPYGDQALNLRCFFNHDQQLPLERYVFGFRNAGAARVVFAGIVGVPVDLASAATRAKVDFANPTSRDAYYDMLLADPRMQEAPDPSTPETSPQLKPACTSTLGRADPARRFVQLAKSFGEDALIQSICGDSFGPPLDTFVERIVKGPD
ncbi:MAG TPA: hypothetical protein VFG30_39220 [Polyangiales bacterium]|nr:hypothetical protein [Polyangiales bacterium]